MSSFIRVSIYELFMNDITYATQVCLQKEVSLVCMEYWNFQSMELSMELLMELSIKKHVIPW